MWRRDSHSGVAPGSVIIASRKKITAGSSAAPREIGRGAAGRVGNLDLARANPPSSTVDYKRYKTAGNYQTRCWGC